MRALVTAGLLMVALAGGAAVVACSKADDVEADEDTGDGGRGDSGAGAETTTAPVPSTQNPQGDSGTTTVDGGWGPSFDITTVASIQGSFVTDQTAANGVSTGAQVTWSFKIDGIVDATQAVTSAKWSAQATNVSGGPASDFPPDANIALQLQRTSGTDPRTATYEFYGNELSPYVYVLVKIEAGKIVDLFYYRRLLDDNETNPPDKPHNVSYTVTNK